MGTLPGPLARPTAALSLLTTSGRTSPAVRVNSRGRWVSLVVG